MLSVEVFGPGQHDRNTAPEYVSGPAMINSFFHGLESVARGQNLVRIPIVPEKLLNRLAPKGGPLFLHDLDGLPPGRQWPVRAI
jgi:hypothetical protein